MELSRRNFLLRMGGTGVIITQPPSPPGKIKAVAFDGLAIFNPLTVYELAEKLFPEKGKQLSTIWRTKQFEYQWLLALANRYENFTTITGKALVYAANAVQVDLSKDKKDRLLSAFFDLSIWPDVAHALSALKVQGIRIVLLSNMTEQMLNKNILSNNLAPLIDEVYSTDIRRTFKPSPAAYQIAVDKLGCSKNEIAFVAFAGWDAAGAKLFGYPTCWVNRLDQPREELGVVSDWNCKDLAEMMKLF